MTYIKHVGVLGMHWGHRKSSSSPSHSDHSTAAALKKRKLHTLSNDELKNLTTRLQLEKQYKDLNTSAISRGHKFLSGILEGAGKQLLSKHVASAVEIAIKSLLEKKKNG